MSDLMTTSHANTSSELLTYEHYLTFPDDGIRKEIIEGDLFMSPAPSIKHQFVSKRLFKLIDNHVDKNKLGEVFYAPCDVIFSDINVMQPDILFISKDNYDILHDLNIQGAPDLLVEILSPSTRETDRLYKKRIYEKFGVKEYWIVDPEAETLEIWVQKDKKFQLLQKANPTEPTKSQLLEGLQIDLSTIFEH